MSEQELLNDIMQTKLELEDIIEYHKLEQCPIAKENIKIEYCKILNSYCAKQNQYRILTKYGDKNEWKFN